MKIAFFDIDNTLTESRGQVSPELAGMLGELSHLVPVAFISGGSFDDIDRQVLSQLSGARMPNVYVLPTEGAEMRAFIDGAWRTVYSYPLSQTTRARILEEIARASSKSVDQLDSRVEDRGGAIAYHALGADAPLEEKYAWDPSGDKRRAIIERLAPRLSGVFMAVAGSTTINFTAQGIDKAFGVSRLLAWTGIDRPGAVFVGDSFGEHENDAPVKAAGIHSIQTSSPEQTVSIVSELIREASDPKTGPQAPKKVAYFCMEYAIEDDLPLFAGGLGILAADIVRAGGRRTDMSLSALGLINRRGIKRLDNGPEAIDYAPQLAQRGYERVLAKAHAGSDPLVIDIPIEGRIVKACAWRKAFGSSTLYLLDTDVPNNLPADRRITDFLYDVDFPTRIAQEMVLGIGGVRLLNALGVSPDIYHCNEGHTAFGALAAVLERATGGGGDKGGEALAENPSFAHKLQAARRSIIATKHTILSGSGTYLSRSDFSRFVGRYIESFGHGADEVFIAGVLDRDGDMFSTTRFLLGAAGHASSVSVAHAMYEKRRYPQSALIPITNGVDSFRWTSPLFAGHPRRDAAELHEAKRELRRELVEFANGASGSQLDPDTLTIVWARRFVAYKRPRLILSDKDRLLALVASPQPIQLVFAGAAYLGDEEGIRALKEIEAIASDPRFMKKVAYIPGYSVATAEKLVRGADVWLNTPLPGYEACGTSGMKAAQNGALALSTVDGWVAEAPDLSAIGWPIPEQGITDALYGLLKGAAEAFYAGGSSPGASPEWQNRVRAALDLASTHFDIQRMLAEYLQKLYNIKQ